MSSIIKRAARRLRRELRNMLAPAPTVEHDGSVPASSVSRALSEVELTYRDFSGGVAPPAALPRHAPLGSHLCKQADFMRDDYRYWMAKLCDAPRFHRKQWEFFYIAQALHERGLLEPGRRGIGFGVGGEPLPALFAAHGVAVVATDQAIEDARRAGWSQTNQHAGSLAQLNKPGICPEDVFRAKVSFREMDMNAIPRDIDGTFDFCWSACCLEHLGSLQAGLDFIRNSVATLKPGGYAIHTTEYNLSSNDQTMEERDLSIYRRRDIEALVARLESEGCDVAPLDLDPGSGFVDGYVDLPPFRAEPHLKLQLGQFACTSLGLIVRRGR